jgi:hypothetical protein
MKRFLAWSIAATIAAGCGGNVVVDAPGEEGGTGGTGTTTTTTIITSGGAGGTGPTICGGQAGLPCAADEWCMFDPPGSCGGFDNAGTCQPRPQGCPADCPGVCGCDGQFFCNACEAHAFGIDTSDGPVCFFDGPPDEYHAFMLPTNAPRYMITKTEHDADRCLQIIVAGFGVGDTNVDVTMGWSVESITISPSAADCTTGLGWPPPPTAVKTSKAKGSIKQDDGQWPCVVDVDVTIGFPPGSPAWVPDQDFMQAFGLIISGGGCQL